MEFLSEGTFVNIKRTDGEYLDTDDLDAISHETTTKDRDNWNYGWIIDKTLGERDCW